MFNLFNKDNNTSGGESGIYMDYAASTPVDEQVLSAMQPFWRERFGNPGGYHWLGRDGKEAITTARETIASIIGAAKEELVFTGSGTESNNMAIFGVIEHAHENGMRYEDMHAITSPIEHPSVLDCFKKLEQKGVSVTYLPVSEDGLIDPKIVAEHLHHNTVLVSIMYVNNEMGAIEPIHDIGKVIDRHRKEHSSAYPLFHTDASQAFLFEDIHAGKLRTDLLTLDGQKIYGPKGVGALYKRKDVSLVPLLCGGNQEYSLRPGTENVPLIVGFAKAAELVVQNRETENERLCGIRDYCIRRIEKDIPGAVINGPIDEKIQERVPNNVNISIRGAESEYLSVSLSEKGIAVGTRSACIGEKGGPSYVLEAMGKPDLASSTLRFSFGKYSSKEDVDRLVETLLGLVCNFDTK